MRHSDLHALLAEIHHSIDRLATDLGRDRPDLAAAVRREAAWLPRAPASPEPDR
jgi:hypothetical protein